MRHISPIVIVVALAVAGAALSMWAPDASAHANQLRAVPAPDDELDVAPERVIIWFTEPIEPRFSTISVLNSAGEEMTAGDTVFDATEPQAMWRALVPLERGTYTVVWRNVSTIDGHRVVGSYLFSVGEPLGAGTVVESADQSLLQSPTDPFIRWVAYVAIAAIVGGLMFEMFVVSNLLASPASNTQSSGFARRASVLATRAMLVLGIVLVGAQLAQLVQQGAIVLDWSSLGFASFIGGLPEVATGSAWGTNWMLKTLAAAVGVCLLLAAHVVRSRQLDDASEDSDVASVLATDSIFGALALAAGVAYLVLVSLASHSAAAPLDVRWIAIAGDAVHIVGAAIWTGGLVYLLAIAFSLREARDRRQSLRFIGAAARRFTPFALVSAAALFASGGLSALMQVAIPDALATPYGWVLVAKVALTVPLVVIAGYNMVSVSRRLESVDVLKRNVMAEIGIAVLALLAAGWLASLEPARQYAERNGIGIADEVVRREAIDGADITVSLEPGTVGANSLTVSIADDSGAAFTSVEQVRARVRFLDGEFGETFEPLTRAGDGIWVSDGVQLSVGGAYQVEVNVIRTDAFDSSVAFRFSARSTVVATDQVRASFNQSSLMMGIVVVMIGLALVATRAVGSVNAGVVNLRRIVGKPGLAGYTGALMMVVGVLAAVNPWTLGLGVTADDLRNPWPPTQESVATGKALYAVSCASCHGDSGRGDGAAAAALDPAPSDLAVHVPLHTDTEIYDFIANGIGGTAMVARSGELSPDEIWHIINYARTIAE